MAPSVGTSRCHLEHVGLVLQGRARTAFDDGRVLEMLRGVHIEFCPTSNLRLGVVALSTVLFDELLIRFGQIAGPGGSSRDQ